ncbi:DUF1616 domain-containing protein [Chloroflexota bacterium]
MIEELFETTSGILEPLGLFRIILGYVLVLFVPGFTWTLVLFKHRQLNILERIALSIGLSIAIVTITLLVLNQLIGYPITTVNSLLVILVLSGIPLLYMVAMRLLSGKG